MDTVITHLKPDLTQDIKSLSQWILVPSKRKGKSELKELKNIEKLTLIMKWKMEQHYICRVKQCYYFHSMCTVFW